MTRVHAYLNFNGDCEAAFEFYKSVFNVAAIGLFRFGDMPEHPDYPLSEADKKMVAHTAIQINPHTMLMGSDCIEAFGQKAVTGTSTSVMLDTDTPEEAKALYAKFEPHASNIEMPLAEQDWAELYASFQDQFGISWMIHYEGNKKLG